jgi:hypothetical protein
MIFIYIYVGFIALAVAASALTFRIIFTQRETISRKLASSANDFSNWVNRVRSYSLRTHHPDMEEGKEGSKDAEETTSQKELRRVAIRDELLELR